jgi:hypothetical protein
LPGRFIRNRQTAPLFEALHSLHRVNVMPISGVCGSSHIRDRIRWNLTSEGKDVLFKESGMELKSRDQRVIKKRWGSK